MRKGSDAPISISTSLRLLSQFLVEECARQTFAATDGQCRWQAEALLHCNLRALHEDVFLGLYIIVVNIHALTIEDDYVQL